MNIIGSIKKFFKPDHPLESIALVVVLQEEIRKAQEATLNGADDSRWRPGETAVDALIRERNRALACLQELNEAWKDELLHYTLDLSPRFNIPELRAMRKRRDNAMIDAADLIAHLS